MNRYIITGTYHNGDNYMEDTNSLAELAYTLSDIERWSDDESISDDERVDASTITIETEEN